MAAQWNIREAKSLDQYDGFNALKKHEAEGVDYLILSRKGSSSIAVMAPHGGGIEPGTVAIGHAVAGRDHTFWAFKGIKNTGNGGLHITSTRFDEPGGMKIAMAAQTVITLHGCHGNKSAVYVGGRHEELKIRLQNAICRSGFNAEISTKAGLRGENTSNLCNRCITGRGVQLEITLAFRKRMFTPWEDRGIRNETDVFLRFVTAVRATLTL